MVSRVQVMFGNQRAQTWTKNIEIQKHPILTYHGIILEKISRQSRESNPRHMLSVSNDVTTANRLEQSLRNVFQVIPIAKLAKAIG